MQCPPNAHPDVQRCKARFNISHGVNPNHVCDVTTCTFWQARQRTFVCKQALHLHHCTDNCSLAITTASGHDACPISGIEMSHQPLQHAMVTKAITGRGGVRWIQTYAYQTTKKKTHKQPPKKKSAISAKHRAISNRLIHTIGKVKPCNQKIVNLVAAAVTANRCLFDALATACNAARVYAAQCPAHIADAVAAYAARIGPLISPQASFRVLVCTIVSLLAVGYTVRDTTIIPRLQWFVDNTPALILYATIDKVQCRAMSTCTRAIKRAANHDAAVAPRFIFTLHTPPGTHATS